MQDVVIIGGSYAGIAAGLQLARGRRQVTVIDAGQRRNRFVTESHGFLGQDGVDPATLWATAKAQLLHYPTVTWVEGTAATIKGQIDAFSVQTQAGEQIETRRILLATGLVDKLPPIKGLSERWGKSVFHCPYCDGYELNQGQIGVLASSAISLHQALLLPDWGPITLLTNEALSLDAEQLAALKARGVTVEPAPVVQLRNEADVELADSRILQFAGLFTATETKPATNLGQEAGCELIESATGVQLQTSDAKETTVAGIFAAGDVARPAHSVSFAVADGAWAGMQIHRSLIWG